MPRESFPMTMIKSFVGGATIGSVARLVFGLTPVGRVVGTTCAIAWGLYCTWDAYSPVEQKLLKQIIKEKFGSKEPHLYSVN